MCCRRYISHVKSLVNEQSSSTVKANTDAREIYLANTDTRGKLQVTITAGSAVGHEQIFGRKIFSFRAVLQLEGDGASHPQIWTKADNCYATS